MKHILQDMSNYLAEHNCQDICVYDLSNEGLNYDYIYLATSNDIASNKALAVELMKDFNIVKFPEGYHKGEWIIFDLGQCVLHLFVASVREKYNLDKLWKTKKMSI